MNKWQIKVVKVEDRLNYRQSLSCPSVRREGLISSSFLSLICIILTFSISFMEDQWRIQTLSKGRGGGGGGLPALPAFLPSAIFFLLKIRGWGVVRSPRPSTRSATEDYLLPVFRGKNRQLQKYIVSFIRLLITPCRLSDESSWLYYYKQDRR